MNNLQTVRVVADLSRKQFKNKNMEKEKFISSCIKMGATEEEANWAYSYIVSQIDNSDLFMSELTNIEFHNNGAHILCVGICNDSNEGASAYLCEC